MGMYAIEAENLSKTFDDAPVLRGVTLRVAQGEVYGLLGPTGAGKSTFLHLLLGFLKPSRGRVRLFGTSNVIAAHKRVGYLPERQTYHTRYTAREYLRFMGEFSDMKPALLRVRIAEILEQVGLTAAADQQIGRFSRSMLQRLGLAQALLHRPDVLLIDEPTSNLESAGQQAMLELLAAIRAQGQTMLLCTHYIDEVEYLCDRVGILVRGRIAVETKVPHLHVPATSVVIHVDRLPPDLHTRLSRIAPAVQCRERMIVLRPNNQQIQTMVLRDLLDAGVAILALEPLERPLEQIYLQAVNGEAPLNAEAWPLSPLPDPIVPPTIATRPSGTGDPLLNELLYRHRSAAPAQPSLPDEPSPEE